MVQMKADMDSVKVTSLLWEQQSMVSLSQPRSYAGVVQSGSGNAGTARTSPKSMSFGSSASKTHSPTRTVLKTASGQGFDGAAIVVELRESEHIGAENIRGKFKDALQTVEGLKELEFLDFRVFKQAELEDCTKQEEVTIRRTAES